MTDTGPIEVNGKLAPDATWQTLRVALIFAGGLAVEHFAKSGEVRAAGLAMVPVVLTYGYGIFKLVKTHLTLKTLARLLPDHLAVLK